MEEEIDDIFASYYIAKELKDLGFNEPCLAFWRTTIDDLKPILIHNTSLYYRESPNILLAPSWDQIQDFMLLKYDILIREQFLSNYKVIWEVRFKELNLYDNKLDAFKSAIKIVKLNKKIT